MLFQAVLHPDYGPMLFLEQPSLPSFLSLVECAIVGVSHPFGKLLQGELGLLQTDSRFTLCTAQDRRIVALIICILFVVGNPQQWGQVCNSCDICFPQFRRWKESFCWEANERSPRCSGRRSRWRSRAGRCWPIDWIVSRQSWRHCQCTL